MVERTFAQPELLDAYTAVMRSRVAASRTPLEDYQAAVAAFNAAPNDLGVTLGDRSGAIAASLDELDRLDALPAVFAAALRAVDMLGVLGHPWVFGATLLQQAWQRAPSDELRTLLADLYEAHTAQMVELLQGLGDLSPEEFEERSDDIEAALRWVAETGDPQLLAAAVGGWSEQQLETVLRHVAVSSDLADARAHLEKDSAPLVSSLAAALGAADQLGVLGDDVVAGLTTPSGDQQVSDATFAMVAHLDEFGAVTAGRLAQRVLHLDAAFPSPGAEQYARNVLQLHELSMLASPAASVLTALDIHPDPAASFEFLAAGEPAHTHAMLTMVDFEIAHMSDIGAGPAVRVLHQAFVQHPRNLSDAEIREIWPVVSDHMRDAGQQRVVPDGVLLAYAHAVPTFAHSIVRDEEQGPAYARFFSRLVADPRSRDVLESGVSQYRMQQLSLRAETDATGETLSGNPFEDIARINWLLAEGIDLAELRSSERVEFWQATATRTVKALLSEVPVVGSQLGHLLDQGLDGVGLGSDERRLLDDLELTTARQLAASREAVLAYAVGQPELLADLIEDQPNQAQLTAIYDELTGTLDTLSDPDLDDVRRAELLGQLDDAAGRFATATLDANGDSLLYDRMITDPRATVTTPR